ncbi:DUF5990 family protein [Catellatospora sp. KI3]|uniref:DUF5990 family protein n=1 Tax=Catellatospora sp. KI3 TaxID=3041620 RepID=UPI0024821AE7|nr:DUF5990 family protein [Catellatospora sp. KI3]MDI1463398.1 DUF5990 family protein [Catellatospora sp. KI3]
MLVRIIGRQLPGASCAGVDGVRVGVQRDRDVEQWVPADGEQAVFEFDVTVVDTADGPDFRGPYVHGRRGERFLYLVWSHASTGLPVMFRRAKLQLAPVAELLVQRPDVRAAVTGTLPLTGRDGTPVCASVRPPWIEWTVTNG